MWQKGNSTVGTLFYDEGMIISSYPVFGDLAKRLPWNVTQAPIDRQVLGNLFTYCQLRVGE